MKVRFQADADLNEIIVGILQRRAPEIDFSTAAGAGLEGLSDPEVLAIAAADGRVLVSHDQTTMPTHFGEFITAQESPGVLIIPQHLSLTAAADELLMIWAASDADEWLNRICHLPL
jgi:predicted nuclease of predicted toxin-antitoxin system